MAMDRNRDSRRANVSSMNGLRKRQRVIVQRDPKDAGVQSELQETVKFGDPERLKKEKERQFTKRRIDRCTAQQRSDGDGRGNGSTDLSDEEYCEDEDDVRVHHPRNRFPSPSSLSAVKNRLGFRNLAAFQDPRNCGDEILGFPVPRRARSATARKFLDTLDARNGGFREPPAMMRSSAMRGALTAPFNASSKKKPSEIKTVFWNSASDFLATPADIEIEAAEALFDLMQQSYSKTQARAEPETLDRDKICDAHDDEDEASAKTKAGESVVGSIGTVKKQVGVEKDKSLDALDEGFEESVREVDPMSKCEVASPKESETLSNVKANACDIRDPTATNANNAADSKARKGIKFEIDLMAPPPLPSSPERDVLVDVDQQAVTKVENRGFSQQLAHTNSKNQLPMSLLPLAGETNNLHGVLPPGGYMPQLQAFYPTDASGRYVKSPQFKMSQPQSKRCALHHCIASNIQSHQQLIKSLSSSSTGPADICGSQRLDLNAVLTPENHVPGDLLLGNSRVLKKSCGSGFVYAIGQLQPMKKLSTSLSAAEQTAGATGNPSLPSIPAERSNMNFIHPVFPPSEAASPLLNNRIAVPPLKGVPSTVPLFGPSFFPPLCFSANQKHQLPIPRSPKLPASQNTSSLSENQPLSLQQKKPDRQLETSRSSNEHGRSSSTPKLGPLASIPTNPNSAQTGSILRQPMGMTPLLPLGKVESLPHGFALPFGTNGYASPVLNFPSTAQSCGTFQLPADVLRTTTTTTKSSTASENSMMNIGQLLNFSNNGSSDLPSAAPSFTEHQKQQYFQKASTIPAMYTQQLKNSLGQQTLLTFGNSPVSAASLVKHQDTVRIQAAASMKGSLRSASIGGGQPSVYKEMMEAPPNQKSSSPACIGGNVISISS